MHHGYDIRVSKAIRQALSALAVGLVLCLPTTSAHAISGEGLVAMASVQGVLIAVANVNRAMREAAENPMDKWRRENVQTAVRAMPPAIIALAADFQAGQLHDKDFPMVQAMLGGFVDVNAADAYNKFLQKPSADLIPKVGNTFPQNILGTQGPSNGRTGSASIVFDDSVAKRNSASSAVASLDPQASQKDEAIKGISAKQDKAADSLRVTFDDNAKKDGSNGRASPVVQRGPASAGVGSPESTISRLEAAMARSGGSSASPAPARGDSNSVGGGASGLGGGTLIRRGPSPFDPSLDADFFDKAKGKKRSPRADFNLKVRPKYWKTTPYIQLIESLMLKEAHAAEGGCQDCGGGEGGGGGDGKAAAAILMGIAQIISAIAPMVVASIDAEKEKEVARTQANAQIEMTNISANTSKFIANQNANVTLTQTAAAERINKLNQDGVSQRLDMQLAELRLARDDASTREKDRLAEEKRLNGERIALAQKQADDNLKLARQSLNAQLTQAGLQTGFGNSRNSGNALTSTTVAGSLASTASSGSTIGSSVAGAATATTSGKAVRGAIADGTSSGSSAIAANQGGVSSQSYSTASSGGTSNGGAGISIGQHSAPAPAGGSSDRALAPSGSSRLLSSATGVPPAPGSVGSGSSVSGARVASSSPLAFPNVINGAASSANGTRAITGGKPTVASANDARALTAVLNGANHRAVRGSSNKQMVALTALDPRAARATASVAQNSDLGEFTKEAAENTSFAGSLRRPRTTVEATGPSAEEVISHTVRNTGGVHNAPAESGGHGSARAIRE